MLRRDDVHLRRAGGDAAHLEAPVRVGLGRDATDVERGARDRRARPALDDAASSTIGASVGAAGGGARRRTKS